MFSKVAQKATKNLGYFSIKFMINKFKKSLYLVTLNVIFNLFEYHRFITELTSILFKCILDLAN